MRFSQGNLFLFRFLAKKQFLTMLVIREKIILLKTNVCLAFFFSAIIFWMLDGEFVICYEIVSLFFFLMNGKPCRVSHTLRRKHNVKLTHSSKFL
jgi:hypothetical protein